MHHLVTNVVSKSSKISKWISKVLFSRLHLQELFSLLKSEISQHL